MKCDSNILVLFQYDGHLIGSAVLQGAIDKPTKLGNEQYYGYYQFASETIQLFEIPINGLEYSAIDSSFTRFGQGMKKVPLDYFSAVTKLINNRNTFITSLGLCDTVPPGQYYLCWLGRSNNTHPLVKKVEIMN